DGDRLLVRFLVPFFPRRTAGSAPRHPRRRGPRADEQARAARRVGGEARGRFGPGDRSRRGAGVPRDRAVKSNVGHRRLEDRETHPTFSTFSHLRIDVGRQPRRPRRQVPSGHPPIRPRGSRSRSGQVPLGRGDARRLRQVPTSQGGGSELESGVSSGEGTQRRGAGRELLQPVLRVLRGGGVDQGRGGGVLGQDGGIVGGTREEVREGGKGREVVGLSRRLDRIGCTGGGGRGGDRKVSLTRLRFKIARGREGVSVVRALTSQRRHTGDIEQVPDRNCWVMFGPFKRYVYHRSRDDAKLDSKPTNQHLINYLKCQ
ncbi:hypothetical protein ACHAWF_005907, partial [Thalassiosira exigua]